MSDHSNSKIATADVLTLLLHNQHALAAAIEEMALWAKASGSSEAHNNVSVQPTHLPNSSIKGDGVRVFLSGRDRP